MTYQTQEVNQGKPIKLWTEGVPVEDDARKQLMNTAQMPFIYRHLAVMPDVHLGKGSTIGSVIPTQGAIIPAAVGVDIGCGMMAARTTLSASDLPDNLHGLRSAIEAAVPHGRTPPRQSRRDKGAWENPPDTVDATWSALLPGFARITEKYPRLKNTNNHKHLGTLGTGNHFIEVCLDEADQVWFMLHSGSRGVGNAIGNLFIELAQTDMRQHIANLPDKDLAYFEEGSDHFADYVEAVGWAQDYARRNRDVMMAHVVAAARQIIAKPFAADVEAVNCHHNYVQRESHFGSEVLVTRKGAVSAKRGELGIIPGSMGARSYIVRGLGNEESFCSCSHELRRLIEGESDIKVVAELHSPHLALNIVLDQAPDLLLLSATLLKNGGLEAIELIMAERPTGILILEDRTVTPAKFRFRSHIGVS
jgi:tRNA-splicing ligase RtcB